MIARIRADPRVGVVEVRGRTLAIQATGGGKLVPAMLQVFEEADLPVTSLSIRSPSLEDIFIYLTGKGFGGGRGDARYGRRREGRRMIRGAIAIFRRDFKKFRSNPFVIIMTLFMPIMYLLIFGNAIGGTITGVPIGVAQETPYVNETPLFTASVGALTHLAQPDKADTFRVTVFSSEATARAALADGR